MYVSLYLAVTSVSLSTMCVIVRTPRSPRLGAMCYYNTATERKFISNDILSISVLQILSKCMDFMRAVNSHDTHAKNINNMSGDLFTFRIGEEG